MDITKLFQFKTYFYNDAASICYRLVLHHCELTHPCDVVQRQQKSWRLGFLSRFIIYVLRRGSKNKEGLQAAHQTTPGGRKQNRGLTLVVGGVMQIDPDSSA
jgi:hypothetical protein